MLIIGYSWFYSTFDHSRKSIDSDAGGFSSLLIEEDEVFADKKFWNMIHRHQIYKPFFNILWSFLSPFPYCQSIPNPIERSESWSFSIASINFFVSFYLHLYTHFTYPVHIPIYHLFSFRALFRARKWFPMKEGFYWSNMKKLSFLGQKYGMNMKIFVSDFIINYWIFGVDSKNLLLKM